MKYIKKYNESKFETIDSFSDDQLKEKLKYLIIERNEISEEISNINKILTDRKENIEERYAETLPKSIFDFNKEQLDWIFENHHGSTSKRYEISSRYFQQLSGVHTGGFNRVTNQHIFSISSCNSFNTKEDGFLLKPEIVRSIKFLGDNLKKHDDGYVLFDISYTYGDVYGETVNYFRDNNMLIVSVYGSVNKKFNIPNLLETIVENDLMNKDGYDDY